MNRVEIFEDITKKMLDTYKKKNSDYGNAFTTIRSKYPESILIRLNDKLLRLEQLMKPGYEAKVEDERLEDSLLDLANYSVMELVEREYDKQEDAVIKDAIQKAQSQDYEDNLVPVWSLGDDGITERYNVSGGLNDIELSYNKDTDMYELWVETIYNFEDNKSMIRWLDNMEVALWKYVNAAEPDVTYKLTLDDALNITNEFTGKTMHECAEKFSFRVNCIADFLEGDDSDL